jgi:hypothetical protein
MVGNPKLILKLAQQGNGRNIFYSIIGKVLFSELDLPWAMRKRKKDQLLEIFTHHLAKMAVHPLVSPPQYHTTSAVFFHIKSDVSLITTCLV